MLGLDLDRGLLEARRKPAEAETRLCAALRCSVLGHLREPRPKRNQASCARARGSGPACPGALTCHLSCCLTGRHVKAPGQLGVFFFEKKLVFSCASGS
jgi:hypothetical protein